MTSPIGTVSQLIHTIRQQLAAERNSLPRRRQRQTSRPAGDAPGWQQTLGLRIAGIDRTDPHRGRKAFRLFIETLLLSHFGDALQNDPKFHQLVEDVHAAMEADAALKAKIDEAIAHLLAGREPR
jgi:hypothetical protein